MIADKAQSDIFFAVRDGFAIPRLSRIPILNEAKDLIESRSYTEGNNYVDINHPPLNPSRQGRGDSLGSFSPCGREGQGEGYVNLFIAVTIGNTGSLVEGVRMTL